MSRLVYNSIEIAVTKTLVFEQNAVYTEDGTQYLYTHFRIAVQGVINPRTMSWIIDNEEAEDAIVSTTPVSPATTDAAIRHHLMTPRATLVYSIAPLPPAANIDVAANRVELLRSPRRIPGGGHAGPSFTVDARNGPSPIGLTILEIQGEKTFIVRYEIETWLNECSEFQAEPARKSILSHRFSTEHFIDRDYQTTRIIRGKAIFNAEQLNHPDFAELVPDDFRSTFMHPVPLGLQRTGVQVRATEDGLAIEYEVVDEQQYQNITRPGITRVEGSITKILDNTHISGGILGTGLTVSLPGVADFGVGVVSNLISFASGGVFGIPPPRPLGSGAVVGIFPMRHVMLTVRCWGERRTTRQQIIDALVQAASGVLNLNIGNERLFPARTQLTLDLNAIYGEMQIDLVFQESDLRRFFNATAAGLLGASSTTIISLTSGPATTIPAPDKITGVTVDAPRAIPNPGVEGGTRGAQFLEKCVAQALSSQCAVPTEARTLNTNAIGTVTTSKGFTGN